MAEVELVNDKTGKRYRVLKLDTESGKIRIVGEHGIEFEDKFDKEMLKRCGYRLQQV